MIPEGLVINDAEPVAPWLGLYRADRDPTWDGLLEIRASVLHFVSRGGRFVQPIIEIADGRYALTGDDTEITLARDSDGETILRFALSGQSVTFRRADR